MRGPRAGWGALTAPPAAQPPSSSPPGPPPAPGAKSAARARFRFRLRRPSGEGTSAGNPPPRRRIPSLPPPRRAGAEAGAPSCLRPSPALRRGGEAHDAPPALGLPTLRPLASPGRARRPRSSLPSARPSERRRPAGSLKRRRLPPPPPLAGPTLSARSGEVCASSPRSGARAKSETQPPMEKPAGWPRSTSGRRRRRAFPPGVPPGAQGPVQGAVGSPLAGGRTAVKSMNGKPPPSGSLAWRKPLAGEEMRPRCSPRCRP